MNRDLKNFDFTPFLDDLDVERMAKLEKIYKEMAEKFDGFFIKTDDTYNAAIYFTMPILRRIISATDLNFVIDVEEVISIVLSTMHIKDVLKHRFFKLDTEAIYCELIEKLYIENKLK